MPPIVSLITPSFNRADLVAQTLDSVRAQSWPHWENIVVDDGSTDRTKDIVADYARRDPRIKLFERSGEPKGACTCRNEGVARSSGEYVMFLDTDDLIEPFCLEQRVAAMQARPELNFAIFPSLMFEKTPHDLRRIWNADKEADELSRQFRHDAICQGTGVLWRKSAFERIGMWDTGLSIWQDIDLFFRAYIQDYRYVKFFDMPADLHNRVNGKSLSRADFFAAGKTRSRAAVIRRAVELLKTHGKSARVREARFMAAEIIAGAARSRQFAIARELLDWADSEGVFTPGETARLRELIAIYRFRLYRFSPLRRRSDAVEKTFACESTLGRISYDDADPAILARETPRMQGALS